MYVISGAQELPDGLYEKIASYRQKVFVERLLGRRGFKPSVTDRPILA